jgi:methionyl-tRNA formyltransferase
MASHPVDAMVVVAYGLILPSWVLQLPKYGCLNIHASLLPRWRGAAPIHRAIEAGDVESGICIMAMDEGLDTGPVYLESRLLLSERETTASLHDRLARLGADSVLEVLRGIQAGTIQTRVQPEHGVTYAHKVQRHESMIRWSDRAIDIDRRVRAFQPFPGTQFVCEGEVIKVLEAFPCSLEGGEAAPLKRVMIEPGETVDASPGEAAVDGSVGRRTDPGTVVRLSGDGVWVSTGDGYLRLGILQRPSGKPLPAETVAKALGWQVGTRLE